MSAKPSDVRKFLVENGVAVGKRGKFSAEQIKFYNKNNAVKYSPGKFVPTERVVVTINGRKRERSLNVAEARATLTAVGFAVGKRGRLSPAAQQAYFDVKVGNKE